MTDPHSAEFFGPLRDLWWNHDFLALLARRFQWHSPLSVLDAGCGQGHWTQALAYVLPAGSRVLGIDREAAWIAEAYERSSKIQDHVPVSFEYRIGDVLQLDLSETFDVVTCQTFLIHVDEPRQAIRSMLRVLRPGGWLVCAEPNNLANTLTFDSTAWSTKMAGVMAGVELELVCELGKAHLGEGFNSAGELLPGWMAEMGLQSIHVYLSDKAMPLWPPYRDEAMAAAISGTRDDHAANRWVWSREKTLRYWRAGGGSDKRFDELWEAVREHRARALADMDRGEWHTAGGTLMYVVAGRKGENG